VQTGQTDLRTSENGLLKIETAAGRLAVSRRYVYNRLERGDLEFVYLGPRMPRVRQADVDKLIEHGAARPVTDAGQVVREATRGKSRQAVA
jgi:excisionase family DNA binding protein